MKPKPRSDASQLNLFQAQFDQLLNLSYPLRLLAAKIDWKRFDVAFAGCYCPEIGAPGKDIRLLVGLHYLKHTFNESDESLLDRWVENPYWQYFCGFDTMQHEVPLHSTSWTKWRQRVGAGKLVMRLEETVSLAVSGKLITKTELAQVNVDATVHISGNRTRQLTRTQKNRRKRRSAVEPKIGHLKNDNRMGRCFLKGLAGDEINAVLAAAGSNLQKLLRAIAQQQQLIFWLPRRLEPAMLPH